MRDCASRPLCVMSMTGHEHSAAMLLVSCAIVNAGASAVLVTIFGLPGAAIGTALSWVIWNVVMALFLWRRLGLSPGVLASFRLPLQKTIGVVAGRARVT